jgi:RNA polymerase sigma factor for flagellar operon FliA
MRQAQPAVTKIGEVWKNYKKTHHQRYRNILLKNYLHLVKLVATKVKVQLPSCVDVEDLASAGVFGLANAIDLFDLKRGIKFETYCYNRIRGSMLDELRALDWVPRLVRIKEHQLQKANKKMEKALNRIPTSYELAKEMKISLRDYNNLESEASVPNIFLFNKEINNNNDKDTELFDLIKDENAEDNLNRMITKDIVGYIKNSLSERERLVIQLYFYDSLTMKEVSEVLEISESRVSQIFNNVMIQLRVRFKRRQVEWLS